MKAVIRLNFILGFPIRTHEPSLRYLVCKSNFTFLQKWELHFICVINTEIRQKKI